MSESSVTCKDRIARIEQLANLQANWDSYGAKTVDLRTIPVAQQVVQYLSKITNVEAPLVSASPDGNVALSWNWRTDTCNLDVEVLATGRLRYCYMDSEDESSDREGVTSDVAVIVEILTAW